jgi:hypothetical protein
MASWKENKVVGIIAGIVFVISLIFVIRGLMTLFPKRAETDAGKVIPPAEQLVPKR